MEPSRNGSSVHGLPFPDRDRRSQCFPLLAFPVAFPLRFLFGESHSQRRPHPARWIDGIPAMGGRNPGEGYGISEVIRDSPTRVDRESTIRVDPTLFPRVIGAFLAAFRRLLSPLEVGSTSRLPGHQLGFRVLPGSTVCFDGDTDQNYLVLSQTFGSPGSTGTRT